MQQIPVTIDGVELSALGQKNYTTLLNKKNEILWPADKPCITCEKMLDWRTDGYIRKERNRHPRYTGRCQSCFKTEKNDQVTHPPFIIIRILTIL